MHLRFVILSVGIAVLLFIGILLFLEIGRRYGLRQNEKLGKDSRTGVGVVDSVVYGLLALLIGFTFNGAAGRFDKRRDLVVEEVSAISTAWDRLAMLPAESQGLVRASFIQFVDALMASYDADPGTEKQTNARREVRRAQSALWATAVAACTTKEGERARMLVLPALNEVSDAVDKEYVAQRIHPPGLVWVMLGVAALAAALFAGYGMATSPRHNWMYVIGVAATISVATFVILELESSRLGLIRIDSIDQTLVELRATMS
jgi:hypothetical protein